MNISNSVNPIELHIATVPVRVFSDKRQLGDAAAAKAASLIIDAINRRGEARILVATGNSQLEMMESLVKRSEVPWSKVEAFHLDEYVGIAADHPASFRHWIRTRFQERVNPRAMHYIQGDATNLDECVEEYGRALVSAPIDVAFVGFGENGHIAFNDPHIADFRDPAMLKRVLLDEACRRQQVGEGHFPRIDLVPTEAITVTCSGLLRADNWICCVPDVRKAKAVCAAFEGPIGPLCPASAVRLHSNAFVYLDRHSAALLA